MKKWFTLGILSVVACCFCGCNATRSLHSPVDETDIPATRELAGKYLGHFGETPVKLAMTFQPDGNVLKIEGEVEEEHVFKKLFPALGGAFRIGDKLYFAAVADLGALAEEGNYYSGSTQMLATPFFLFELSRQDELLIVRQVTFATYSNNKFTPLNSTVKLDNAIVLNPGNELYDLMAAGKYQLLPFASLRKQ